MRGVRRVAVGRITLVLHAVWVIIFIKGLVIQHVQTVTGEIAPDSYVKNAMKTA